MLENSAAYKSKLALNHQILAINDFNIHNNLENWLEYFENDKVVLKINRNGKIINLDLVKPNDIQYFDYKISKK